METRYKMDGEPTNLMKHAYAHMTTEKTAGQRIDDVLAGYIEDLETKTVQELREGVLSIGRIAPATFKILLAWGGPAFWFEIKPWGDGQSCKAVFQDWGECAERPCDGILRSVYAAYLKDGETDPTYKLSSAWCLNV